MLNYNQNHENKESHNKTFKSKDYRGGLIMVLGMISIAVFWLPNNLYYTIVYFSPDSYEYTVDTFLGSWTSLQIIMDPFLFGVALKDVRGVIIQLFLRPNQRP